MMNIFGLCIPLIRCYILLMYIMHLINIIVAFKISMTNVGCMNIQCSQFPSLKSMLAGGRVTLPSSMSLSHVSCEIAFFF